MLDKAKPGNTHYAYSAQFKHNVSNLAAWKAHRMATDLVALDKKEDIAKAIKRYNQGQAVEYNAITSRARTARQLMDFEQRSDMYPNLKWIRSRSANPREAHLQLVGLVLPADDPFWQTNQPGNLYGCKCDWTQTDEAPSQNKPKSVTPSPGLDGNPINTGELLTRRAGHFKAGSNKIVPEAILQLSDDVAYLSFNTPSGKPVRVHIAHGTDELRNNLEIFSMFANLDKNIKNCVFLPKIDTGEKRFRQKFYPNGNKMQSSTKNADAIISFKNGDAWVTDMKSFKSKNLRKRLNEAAAQGDYLVIRMETNYHNTGFIKNTIDDMITKESIKGAVVFDKNGKLIYRSS